MKMKVINLFVLALFFLFAGGASAHCDSINGPVVKASKIALETGDINRVLIWIQAKDENEIRGLFNKVLNARKLNADVKELADNYFFETVVRVHRMGEGVGYTGLRPADYKPEEGIEAADIAIEKNSVNDILAHLKEEQHSKVKDMFADLQTKKDFKIDDVKAGREYVAAYVHFIHYIEALYNNTTPAENEHHHH